MTNMQTQSRTKLAVRSITAALAIAAAAVPVGNVALAQDGPVAASHSYHGPKKTVAVSQFDANGAFVARYGGYDIGGGIAAMLISALRKTDRFVVLERAELNTLLNEKQLGLTGVTSSATAQQKLMGAQLFIRGSVTEFSEQDKGGGFNIGFGLGGFSNSLGTRSRKGSIAIDIRLIDAASGRIVSSYTAKRKIKSRSVGLRTGRGGFSLGTDGFKQTPLGKATREAIQDAVSRLVRDQQQVPWQALVARVDGNRVYVNAGSNANVRSGSRMLATRTINVVTDPSTGEVLGSEKATLGSITINQVQGRYSVGTFDGSYALQRGDIVNLASR
ncbi:MAG: hypothetical protein KUG65_00440 [Sphingomonadaceae bacterium]|nr:hypothetical protein [Sphingomonadaceae bacterium]